MRKKLAMLAVSVLLCVGSSTGAYASPPTPDRKVYATEYVMYLPTAATCVIETMDTTHYVELHPVLGPVAPASLVAVDDGIEYLALVRPMTFPPDHRRELVSLLGSMRQENDKHHIDPIRQP